MREVAMSPLTRSLAGEQLFFDLADQIADLRNDDAYTRSGRVGRTLVKSGPLRLTLTVMADGVDVGTHQAETPMTLHVLEGGLRYKVGDQEFALGQGELLFFGPGHARDIKASGDTALLLTITGDDGA